MLSPGVNDVAVSTQAAERGISATPLSPGYSKPPTQQEYAGGVIYECGKGSWVFMYPSPGAGTSKASAAFWAVDDIVAEVAELKARGVVFEDYNTPGIQTENSIATGGGAKTAWFKDTEGNILAVSQRV
jgi:hypothetical protein